MNQKQPKFLCIGLILQDLLIKGVNALPKHWEETIAGTTSFSDTGGGAANSARTFGRLGADVAIIGRVGCDSIGRMICDSFRNDNVSIEHLVHVPNESSGISSALVRDDGQRCFATVRGCNKTFCIDDFKDIDFSHYDYVHINGYFQFPALEPNMPALLKEAKEKGCIVSFDTASWDPSGRWFTTIQPFARYIDYFFANENQLFALTKTDNLDDAANFLLSEQVKNVIAKCGEQGSILYDSKMNTTRVGAFTRNAIDTTGAGDSFDAAYMIGVSKGWSPKKCGAFANTVAGLNCEKLGATSGVPSYNDAIHAMESNHTYTY